MEPADYVIVSRIPAFPAFALKRGLAPQGAANIPGARARDVNGKIVVGSLPAGLAVFARAIVHVPVNARGRHPESLSYDELRESADAPIVYRCQKLESPEAPDLVKAANLAAFELRRLGGNPELIAELEAAARGVKP